MQRDSALARLEGQSEPWDLLIIGGGATGLGCAIDASARGYRTLLLEMHDFAKATSSRSTKLVHGGVRYLQQGNIALVLEALRERGRLQQNAPHLVSNLAFVVPNYDWWEGPFYGIGMKVYDVLAGRQNFGRSKHLNIEETLERLPTIEPEGLRGGVIYYDGLFDDARLAVNMAQTVDELGGVALNYVRVNGLTKDAGGQVNGAHAVDEESGKQYRVQARAVINATGIFTDTIRKMDDPEAVETLRPSQGVHIVLDKSFLPGDAAIMVPETDDGRVLFAIPWLDRVVVGTTDTEVEGPELEPRPFEQEIDFLVEHAARYLTKDPTHADILSAFAGIRPLVSNPGAPAGATKEISREHVLHISNNGLVTISGGKWTTYRKMAEDTIDQAAALADLPESACPTKELRIHGWSETPEDLGPYGSDQPALDKLIRDNPELGERLDERLPIQAAHVLWAVREEMARSVEDVLSRRTRCLLLNARAAIDVAPRVAELMAAEMSRNAAWREAQVEDFRTIARGYLVL